MFFFSCPVVFSVTLYLFPFFFLSLSAAPKIDIHAHCREMSVHMCIHTSTLGGDNTVSDAEWFYRDLLLQLSVCVMCVGGCVVRKGRNYEMKTYNHYECIFFSSCCFWFMIYNNHMVWKNYSTCKTMKISARVWVVCVRLRSILIIRCLITTNSKKLIMYCSSISGLMVCKKMVFLSLTVCVCVWMCVWGRPAGCIASVTVADRGG